MIRDGKIVKRRDGIKGQKDVRVVHEKANQTRKEKQTGAQAGKKPVTKSYSHMLLPPYAPEWGEVVSTQQNEQKESRSNSTNKAHCIPILDTKYYLFDC